jgi:hypothetical protein
MRPRHTTSICSSVAPPGALESATTVAMLQKLSPDCTTHCPGTTAVGEFGDAGAGAGGAVAGVVVVVGGVVVVGAVVVDGSALVLVVDAAVVVVGAAVVVVGAAVVVGAVVVGAVVVVTSVEAAAATGGDEDASAPPATGAPLPQAANTVTSTPTLTSSRSPRVTART